MTWREIIADVLSSGIDLDMEASVRIVTRDRERAVASAKVAPVSYATSQGRIVIEDVDLRDDV